MQLRMYSIDTKEIDAIYDKELNSNPIGQKGIVKYRTKTIKSGSILECEVYPVWNTYSEARKAKDNISREAQKNLNHKNRVKKAIRLINTNFSDLDIWATFTYSDDKLPSSYDDALAEFQRFIRRLKRHAKKHNYDDLKYIYTIEKSKKGRYHHHIVINFKDRDELEKLWCGGARKQTRRLQSDEFGYEGLARYIAKEQKENNRQAFICSKNLKKPKVSVSDYKISRAQARKIAAGELDPIKLFEKLYRQYTFNNVAIKTSEYVEGCYLYVKMHRFRI